MVQAKSQADAIGCATFMAEAPLTGPSLGAAPAPGAPGAPGGGSLRVVFDGRPGRACATGIGRYAATLSSLLRDLPGVEPHDLTDPRFAPACASPLEEVL